MDRKSRAVFLILAWIATIAMVLWLPRRGGAVLRGDPACAGCRLARNAMIRFELAGSREEVEEILQPADTPCGQCTRRYLDAENYVDYGFMLAYSALNLAIVLFLAPPVRTALPGRGGLARLLIALGVAFAAAMFLGDALENLGLLRLTRPDPDYASAIRFLYPATRLKWSALAVESLLVAILYGIASQAGRGRLLLVLVLPYAGAAVYGFLAVTSGNPARYGPFYTWLAVAWLGSLLHAVLWLILARSERSDRQRSSFGGSKIQ